MARSNSNCIFRGSTPKHFSFCEIRTTLMWNFSDRPQQHWHHERQTGYAPSIHTVHSQIVSNRVGIRSSHFAFEERGEVKIPALSPAMHLRSGQQPSVGRGAGGEQVAPREDTYGKCYRCWRHEQTHVCYITVYARQILILLLKIASHCWSQSKPTDWAWTK